ncbi:MAG: hypothetical protein KAI81_00935, partial [Candidatus Marinimicrobia bacterium]|nr:hypothetical protein [Candidatus Neomarinimicrobiota bacterium]
MEKFLLIIFAAIYLQAGILDEIKDFHPDDLKIDTLLIEINDSLLNNIYPVEIEIQDLRKQGPDIIDIHQTKKIKYIPVDQLVISQPRLDSLILAKIDSHAVLTEGILRIQHLSLWYDSRPYFKKGHKLNVYSVFNSTDGKIHKDWLWEISLKKKRKEKNKDYFRRMLLELAEKQAKELNNISTIDLYPYNYRRQILSWSDFILYPNAWGLNVHFTIDYPAGRMDIYERGSPGIFYYKSKDVENISMGGKHQSWNW